MELLRPEDAHGWVCPLCDGRNNGDYAVKPNHGLGAICIHCLREIRELMDLRFAELQRVKQ